jgi:hypothetical protein
MHRPSRRSALLSFVALSLAGPSARAQQIVMASTTSPAALQSTHYAMVPAILVATAGAVQPSPRHDGVCASASCFEATVIVRANTKWQLQVVQRQPLDSAAIDWLDSGSPQVAHRLAVGVYQTVASGQTAAFSQSLTLSFAAPTTATELGASLDYRVVALP